jgi:hypothetical protein
MSDYPDYFPSMMQDFHECKMLVKAFYTWLDLLDTRQEQNGKKFDNELHRRRSQMCNWVDFNILMVSFFDFLFTCGYQIQRTRRKGDFLESEAIRDLSQFQEMYYSLCYPKETLAWNEEYTKSMMLRWLSVISYMPEEVQKAWKAANICLKSDGGDSPAKSVLSTPEDGSAPEGDLNPPAAA